MMPRIDNSARSDREPDRSCLHRLYFYNCILRSVPCYHSSTCLDIHFLVNISSELLNVQLESSFSCLGMHQISCKCSQ